MEKFPPNAASSRGLNLPQAVVGKDNESVFLPVQGNPDQTSRLWPPVQTQPILSDAEQSLWENQIMSFKGH